MLCWDIAVYVLNKERRRRDCLIRVATSLVGSNSHRVVLLNGSRDGSIDVACKAVLDGLPTEIHRIEACDKSSTINQLLHHIRRPSRAVGAVDSYAYVGPRSFFAVLARLDERPDVMATTGSCLEGRTMKLATEATLTKVGQLHSQQHALPAHADDMARTYLLTHPPPPMHGLDRWVQHLALRNLRTIAPLGPRLLLPERVRS